MSALARPETPFLVALFLLCALAFFAVGHGLLAIAALLWAGIVACCYRGDPA